MSGACSVDALADIDDDGVVIVKNDCVRFDGMIRFTSLNRGGLMWVEIM